MDISIKGGCHSHNRENPVLDYRENPGVSAECRVMGMK
jgi:hypothetical protein